MPEPVDMDKAIAATERVFPPATARLLAARFQGVLEVAAIHPGLIDMAVVESAREVLALAEQQQTRPERPVIALMRPDRKVVAVLDNPQFEESYQLVGIGEPVDGHSWARPAELAGWIPLVPAQNGAS